MARSEFLQMIIDVDEFLSDQYFWEITNFVFLEIINQGAGSRQQLRGRAQTDCRWGCRNRHARAACDSGCDHYLHDAGRYHTQLVCHGGQGRNGGHDPRRHGRRGDV